MDDCDNIIRIRSLNQSTKIVKAIVRVVNGINVEELTSQIIIAGISEYICIPHDLNLQNPMVYLYYVNIVTGKWVEFAAVPVSSLDVNLLWITEQNGVVQLTPYGCSNTNNISGELYYLQLHNEVTGILRIYVSYYIDGKFHSKKMPGVIDGETKKVWVPIEAKNLTIKIQNLFFSWIDLTIFNWDAIQDNHCFVGASDRGKYITKEVSCS